MKKWQILKRRKEGNVTDNILLGKYQILKILGKNENGIVYLARHCNLHQQRVIKRIDKQNPRCSSLLKEVKFLKNLVSISVPTLFDFEEGNGCYYIVEEYIEGDSLKDLFSVNKNVNIQDIINCFIQLTELFVFLHEQKPYPILYLDLKPEHIVFSKNALCIVDFGAAVELKGSEIEGCCMGTEGFAAPELVQGGVIDERTDIYSIGALLYWCLTGELFAGDALKGETNEMLKDYPEILQRVIAKCLEDSKENRFESAKELVRKLKEIYKICDEVKSSYKIAVVGSQPRIGVTHFCVSFVCYLNSIHRKCLYEERTDSAFLSTLCENRKGIIEERGIMICKNFYGLPRYGKAIVMEDINYNIVVQDCGCLSKDSKREIEKADVCIFLGGIKEWEIENTRQIMREAEEKGIGEKAFFVLWGGVEKNGKYRKLFRGKRVFFMPYNAEPFKLGKEFRGFLKNLVNQMFLL